MIAYGFFITDVASSYSEDMTSMLSLGSARVKLLNK
jgi:hypothetical protein